MCKVSKNNIHWSWIYSSGRTNLWRTADGNTDGQMDGGVIFLVNWINRLFVNAIFCKYCQNFAFCADQSFEYFILKKNSNLFSNLLWQWLIRLYEYKTHDSLKDISLDTSPNFWQKTAIHTVNPTIRIDCFTAYIKSVWIIYVKT